MAKNICNFHGFQATEMVLTSTLDIQYNHPIIIYLEATKLYCYSERLSECSGVLRGLLDHHQVRGKPILLLANKSDVDTAQVGHV